MSQHTKTTPELRRHKTSNRGYVRHVGKQIYFKGKYTETGPDATCINDYKVWCKTEFVQRKSRKSPDLTIAKSLELYAEHYWTIYDRNDSQLQSNFRQRIRELLRSLAHILDKHPDQVEVADLGIMRDLWVDRKLSIRSMRHYFGYVRKFFQWCVGRGLTGVEIIAHMDCLPPIDTKEYPTAKPPQRRQPVTVDQVKRTLPFLTATTAAMVQTSLHTGMRPGELCRMRWQDIDVSGEIWVYSPPHHKNAWRGKDRNIYIGETAQTILNHYQSMRPLPDSEYIWMSGESWVFGRLARQNNRQTAAALVHNIPFQMSGYLKTQHFHQAIQRACKTAGVDHWTPYQCRHYFAREMLKGITQMYLDGDAAAPPMEAVASLLGHYSVNTTEIYTGKNEHLAKGILKQLRLGKK